MPKAKTGAKKAADKKPQAKAKAGLLKSASKGVAKAAARLVKAAQKVAAKPAPKAAAAKAKPAGKAKAPAPKAPARVAAKAVVKETVKAAPAKVTPVKAAPAKVETRPPAVEKPAKAAKAPKAPRTVEAARPKPPPAVGLSPFDVKPDKPIPRASKLPPPGEPLTKREMEQLLTAGAGRGVFGEGSLKGRLVVKDGFPYLQVIGRDKRELSFLLQGPDQEVLPAYLDHKVSVSGLIKKSTNYGGTVDVRKYSAKKPESEETAEPAPQEQKLRYLSPGELEQVQNAGMGAGMKGFATLRGSLEMTGDEFFLVCSNGGTRHQVSFTLQGKGAKGLRKLVGALVTVTGVVDKSSGWGGIVDTEKVEPRPIEFKAISRENMEIAQLDAPGEGTSVEVRLNHGLSVRLPERAGFTWAIDPTMAKRLSLREANFEPSSSGPHSREFFFTPRNPGTFELEFFLAKVHAPGQVNKTLKLMVHVKAV